MPQRRNSRDQNARIKSGEEPKDWSQNKRRQKDVQARCTQTHGKSDYGYKNHIGVNRQHKVIRKGAPGRQLDARAQDANRKRSTIRARVVHVFAQQANRQP